MSLRQDLIEAGLRAVESYDFVMGPKSAPEVVLDAMLDLLTERADEWAEVTGEFNYNIGDLLAILRNPGSADAV